MGINCLLRLIMELEEPRLSSVVSQKNMQNHQTATERYVFYVFYKLFHFSQHISFCYISHFQAIIDSGYHMQMRRLTSAFHVPIHKVSKTKI